MVMTERNRTDPFSMASGRGVSKHFSRGSTAMGSYAPKASLALSNGNFSIMQSMFSSCVKRIASAESLACPDGHDWIERP